MATLHHKLKTQGLAIEQHIENPMYKCKRRESKYSKDKHNDSVPIYSKGRDSETQRSMGYV